MQKKIILLVSLFIFTNSLMSMDEKDNNKGFGPKSSSTNWPDLAKSAGIGFALTWLGKTAYKHTDVTNKREKMIGFGCLLIPAGLLYLHNHSNNDEKSTTNYVIEYGKKFLPNGIAMLAGFGAGVIIPSPL